MTHRIFRLLIKSSLLLTLVLVTPRVWAEARETVKIATDQLGFI